jgi:hypothetical protein
MASGYTLQQSRVCYKWESGATYMQKSQQWSPPSDLLGARYKLPMQRLVQQQSLTPWLTSECSYSSKAYRLLRPCNGFT